MPFPRNAILEVLLFLLLTTVFVPAAGAEDWPPVSPEELKMTSEPLAVAAPAIYLYRQVDRDDNEAREYVYSRIKILTEEGRIYADIEVPFVKGFGLVKGIQARTIHPDGTIIDFDGKVYEKTIVKARGLKYLAKTFTLPDVQVGSIVEYRYTHDTGFYWALWILNEDLFTKYAKFSLRKNIRTALEWSWPLGLPPGTDPPRLDNGVIHLETRNVPPFQVEDYMPPQNQMKLRVEFDYTSNREKDAAKFWKQEGKRLNQGVENFVGHHRAIEDAVAEIVLPSDSPETKLQKIYARTQQIRNLSFELEKSDQEQKRDKLKENNDVEDVWKHGYGSGYQITWLFLALVRAAGLEVHPVLVSTRDEYFFDPKMMKVYQLNTNAVLVKMQGKDIYLDPGAAFTPYGFLPWRETESLGLRLDKDGGDWVETPRPDASQSRVERKASLKLTEIGDLEGKLTVTFTGLEALWRRLDEMDDDDSARKKFLEDEIKLSIPTANEVELINKPDWSSSSPSFVAEFNLKIPGWASAAGRRELLSVGLFSEADKHVFERPERVHPIYFHFPFQAVDDVTLDLPPNLQVSSLPPVQDTGNTGGKVCSYKLNAENKNGVLHWKRQLTVDAILLETKYYPALRNFFQAVRSGDEQQIVLSPI